MKIHNVVILFVSVFFAVFLFYSYVNQKSVSFNRTNIEYANMLTAACHDAAKTINVDSATLATGVWDDKEKIGDTLGVFYGSLSRSLNLQAGTGARYTVEYTPFVLLVDINGFYLSYNACFDEYGNAIVPQDLDALNVVSNLNTWTDTYHDNIVRFYLTDYVEVTTRANNYYAGERTAVWEQLTKAGEADTALAFLIDDTLFSQERVYAIVTKIESIINYYLNSQTVNVDGYNTGYQVTLPQLTGEEWSRMLKNPTVISFMQGRQGILESNMLNIYAYAAGELTESYLYFIMDGYYYRIDGNVETETITITENGVTRTTQRYLYNGTPIETFYTSMEECARQGAVPAEAFY